MTATTPKKRAIRNRMSKNTWSKMMSAVGILKTKIQEKRWGSGAQEAFFYRLLLPPLPLVRFSSSLQYTDIKNNTCVTSFTPPPRQVFFP